LPPTFPFFVVVPVWVFVDLVQNQKLRMGGLWGPNRGRCVNYFTLRTIIILMETIEALYKRSLDHASKLSQIEAAFAAL
jgi:hypothetical protein